MFCTNDSIAADAMVIGIPYSYGASFGLGAERGPAAILACMEQQIELFERFTATEPALLYRIRQEILSSISSLSPEEMIAKVANRLSRIDAFTVLLGGVHTVSISAFESLQQRFQSRDITILQIDAHLDMRDDDSDYNMVNPSRFSHACIMRRAVEMGFKTCSVGTRAYSIAEYQFAKEKELPIFEMGRGKELQIEDILAAIKTEKIYITIDVDGFDPSIFPATGTPVPGGISWEFGTALLRRVISERDVIGADIVETAPDRVLGITEYAAAQLCYDLISYKLLKSDGKLYFV